MSRRPLLVMILALATGVVYAVGSSSQSKASRPVPHRGGDAMASEAKAGLVFRLSEGQDEGQAHGEIP